MPLLKRIGKNLAGAALSLATCSGAMADVVVVVSPNSPVTSLSSSQVTDIFLGKIGSFPSGERAVPLDLAEGADARNQFYLKHAGKSPAQVKSHWSKLIFTGRGLPPREVRRAQDIKLMVSQNPHMIGYLDSNEVDSRVKVVTIKDE